MPIDQIKEQRDESGAKRGEQGRDRREKGCFTSLPSYKGISRCSNWLTKNSSQFSSRLEIVLCTGQVCCSTSGSGLHLYNGKVRRRDTASTFENRSEKP